jgi:uncharacterized protein (TIGR00255 family)
MTGYGQATEEGPGLRVTVFLRSVNNRYLDLRVKLPADLAPLEGELRRRIQKQVRRGRVELSLNVERTDGAEHGLALNRSLVATVIAAAEELRREHGIDGDLEVGRLLALPGVLHASTDQPTLTETERGTLDGAVDAALTALDRERAREGETLRRDLLSRVETMLDLVGRIRQEAAALPALARDRLRERIEAMTRGLELDSARLAQEAAIQADRSDVTEEIVRLQGHLEQLRALLDEPDGGPLGKRVDFLLQEVHRETNTVGSKSVSLKLSRLVLELKTETEKVREQTQNLE